MLDVSTPLEVRAPRHRLETYFRLILPIKSLVTGAFGFATVGALLALDAAYALDWSLTGTVAIGSSVFVVLSLFQLRRHWRRALLGLGAAWVASLIVVFSVLFSGVINDSHIPTVEAVAHTMLLQKVLESARAKGVEGSDWDALMRAGIVTEDTPGMRYYDREDITWNLRFNEKGEFKGEVYFKGDPLHNIPSCTGHINERGRPVVATGDFKKYLPVRPKDMQ